MKKIYNILSLIWIAIIFFTTSIFFHLIDSKFEKYVEVSEVKKMERDIEDKKYLAYFFAILLIFVLIKKTRRITLDIMVLAFLALLAFGSIQSVWELSNISDKQDLINKVHKVSTGLGICNFIFFLGIIMLFSQSLMNKLPPKIKNKLEQNLSELHKNPNNNTPGKE